MKSQFGFSEFQALPVFTGECCRMFHLTFVNLAGATNELLPVYLNFPTEEAVDASAIVHTLAPGSLIPQGLLEDRIIIDCCFCK